MNKQKQPKKTNKRVLLESIPSEDIIAAYNALFQSNAQQDDEYSLAQPHAFRFVPNLLSDDTATNNRR